MADKWDKDNVKAKFKHYYGGLMLTSLTVAIKSSRAQAYLPSLFSFFDTQRDNSSYLQNI